MVNMLEMTSKAFKDAVDRGAVVIVPVGSVEEHGPHLPLGTDCIQPMAIAEALAEELDAVIAPFIYYGNCTSTADFPGTITIRPETLQSLAYDVLSSLTGQGCKRIVVISGHAGRNHMASLRIAAGNVVREYDVSIMVFSDYDYAYELPGKWDIIPEWDGHAGTIETARIMALRPELVVVPLPKGHRARFPRALIMKDVKTYIPEGYWGAPEKATPELGRDINEYLLQRILTDIKANFSL